MQTEGSLLSPQERIFSINWVRCK